MRVTAGNADQKTKHFTNSKLNIVMTNWLPCSCAVRVRFFTSDPENEMTQLYSPVVFNSSSLMGRLMAYSFFFLISTGFSTMVTPSSCRLAFGFGFAVNRQLKGLRKVFSIS